MPGIQLDRVLDLIEENISQNRSEVLSYIQTHTAEIMGQLADDQRAEIEIPTTAGVILIDKHRLGAESAALVGHC